MRDELPRLLERWTGAGVIDEETATRIRAFERERAGSRGMRWPILIALAFGGIMIAGGVLLFVAAHWDTLSPASRFALVLVLVAVFHVAGALTAGRFPAMAATLHAIGTAALGAGIFLAGQIFNLDEHWPGGVMLWALGAAIAWLLLKQLPQLALTAILVPAWLVGEWTVAARGSWTGGRVIAAGVFTLALAYFTAPAPGRMDRRRAVLLWAGGIALVPASIYLAVISGDTTGVFRPAPPSTTARVIAWIVALGGPLAIAGALRRRHAWPNAVAAAWAGALFLIASSAGELALYPWWALAAVGLVAWGVQEGRGERINMGAAMFAASVLAFYFSAVMDKLGRSASLVGLGVLFLAGGWALERVRRKLVLEARGQA
jgi:uncharacterized membrane protein